MRRFKLAAAAVVGLLAGMGFRSFPVGADGGGGGPPPLQNGDVNADGTIDLTDAIGILNWLFLAGPEPAPIVCGREPALLPASGQAGCFNDAGDAADCSAAECPGQDGAYRTGCPAEGRFLDRGDGTVEDRCTGLLWVKQAPEEAWTWCEALAYCEGLEHPGSAGWRLPNARELESLVDFGRPSPAIDPVFTAFPGGHWTSTSFTEAPDSAWCVVFSSGTSEPVPKGFLLRARAVRNVR
ncbi:MAG: DUF1566 domain-containing protein [Thermoanaerobaculia bacterium]